MEYLTELKPGFLSPTGEFYLCGYMGHISLADKILEVLCPDKYFEDPEEQLRKMGWVDIHMELPSRKYSIYWNKYNHLSPEQIHILKPLFYDFKDNININTIYYLTLEFE